MAAVFICSDFGTQENKVSHYFHFFPHLFAMKWWDWMPWSLFFECWVLSQLFQLSSFTFIKRLFSSSLLSAIRMVSSVYLNDTTHVAESRIIGAQYILAEWILKIITPHALVLPTDYLNYCTYNIRQSTRIILYWMYRVGHWYSNNHICWVKWLTEKYGSLE